MLFLRRLVLVVVSGLLLIFGTSLLWNSLFAPVSTLMVARWLSGEPVIRAFRPLETLTPVARAVIASEDSRFCRHNGVDWEALRTVLTHADGPSRGASTLTMQLAKNLFLWPDRSYLRKGLEIPLALFLDSVWSKDHILEAYLNMAEWGDGIFGAEAAAQAYFKKSARSLSSREATLLASALPNPARRNPVKPTALQHRHASRILARMNGVTGRCF
jgi:monofunctional glycosyltransferase